MAVIVEHVDVEAPIEDVWAQWTRFELFPQFMHAVQSITRTGEGTFHWVVQIGGVQREFDTTVVESRPREFISWRGEGGIMHEGSVTFESLPPGEGGGPSVADESGHPHDAETRVTVRFTWDDETLLEKAGQAVGVDQMQVNLDLHRFKEYVESGPARN